VRTDGSVPVAIDDQCAQASSSGAYMFDTIGLGYALLSFNSDNEAEGAFTAAAAAQDLSFTMIADASEGARDAYDAFYVLVRSDLFVAWASDTLEPKSDAILARALGR
jgi:hypothetical protein